MNFATGSLNLSITTILFVQPLDKFSVDIALDVASLASGHQHGNTPSVVLH